MLNRAPCGFLSFRDDGTITGMNQTLKELLAYENEEPVGTSIENILTTASRIFYYTHFFPLIRLHGKASEISFSLRSKNGSKIPVLANAVRRKAGEGYTTDCVFIPVLHRNKFEKEILSAKKAAEDAVRKNEELVSLASKLKAHTLELDQQYIKALVINKNLTQFSKIISHDVQEPIHKIQVLTDVISGEAGSLPPRMQAALRKISAATDRLRKLTEGLDQYIQVDDAKQHQTVDLNKILESARAKVSAGRDFHDFDVQSDILPVLDGHEAQLELLFYHLIDNAIQYRSNSRLLVTVTSVITEENVYQAIKDRYEYTEHVKITVGDNGIGFDNKYSEYVFELLAKIDPLSPGMGVGLSLCKKIVDNHAGMISACSEIGKGTKFTVLLPLKKH